MPARKVHCQFYFFEGRGGDVYRTYNGTLSLSVSGNDQGTSDSQVKITAEEMLIDMNVKHKDDNLERSEFGRCSMLLYECEDVDNLKHYFANSTRSSSGSSHSKRLYGYSHGDSNHSSDSYNVHDYDDPEDFYYDNEDDFDGIDDAETYFYDHND